MENDNSGNKNTVSSRGVEFHQLAKQGTLTEIGHSQSSLRTMAPKSTSNKFQGKTVINKVSPEHIGTPCRNRFQDLCTP